MYAVSEFKSIIIKGEGGSNRTYTSGEALSSGSTQLLMLEAEKRESWVT